MDGVETLIIVAWEALAIACGATAGALAGGSATAGVAGAALAHVLLVAAYCVAYRCFHRTELWGTGVVFAGMVGGALGGGVVGHVTATGWGWLVFGASLAAAVGTAALVTSPADRARTRAARARKAGRPVGAAPGRAAAPSAPPRREGAYRMRGSDMAAGQRVTVPEAGTRRRKPGARPGAQPAGPVELRSARVRITVDASGMTVRHSRGEGRWVIHLQLAWAELDRFVFWSDARDPKPAFFARSAEGARHYVADADHLAEAQWAELAAAVAAHSGGRVAVDLAGQDRRWAGPDA